MKGVSARGNGISAGLYRLGIGIIMRLARISVKLNLGHQPGRAAGGSVPGTKGVSSAYGSGLW